MADAADSKSAMVYPCVGSSPTSGTNLLLQTDQATNLEKWLGIFQMSIIIRRKNQWRNRNGSGQGHKIFY